MAGKTKRQGSRPKTPNSARGMMGHLGVKSGPLAPTDSKLMSQYMVLDHMAAHYKNLSKVKPAVDTSTPKTWLTSQKSRDRSRRAGLKNEYNRRNDWLAGSMTSRPPTRDSMRDREDLIAMMESFSNMEGDLDDLDGVSVPHNSHSVTVSTSKANRLNDDDLSFVDHMIEDDVQAPSKYHSQKRMKSYIPNGNTKKINRTEAPPATRTAPKRQTSADIINKQSHKFTEEKPFTPRTLKTKKYEVPSRLSTFKYYTPPAAKRTAQTDTVNPPQMAPQQSTAPPRPSMRGPGSVVSRPDTAYSDTVDLMMNETLMSRDMNQNETPMGVPPLDISLDADNIRWMKEQSQRGWLREQSTRKAHLRASARSRSEVGGSDAGSIRGQDEVAPMARNVPGTMTVNGTQTFSSKYPNTYTMAKVKEQEEELQYLEFVTDVTNDVLDRGIFTNRVLRQVFDAHIEKRKRHLKPHKMREMLENLRVDLGIPEGEDEDEDEDYGMKSVRGRGTLDMDTSSGPRAARRRQLNGEDSGVTRSNMPVLRAGVRQGKPPLPRPGSRGARSRPGSSCSNLLDVKEEPGEDSLTFTTSGTTPTTPQHTADILTIEHADDTLTNGHHVNGYTQEADGYQEEANSYDGKTNGYDDKANVSDANTEEYRDKSDVDEYRSHQDEEETKEYRESEYKDSEYKDGATEQHTDAAYSDDDDHHQGDNTESHYDDHHTAGGSEDMMTRLSLTDDDHSNHGNDQQSLTALYEAQMGTETLGYDDDDDVTDDALTTDRQTETPRAPPKPTPRSRRSASDTPRSTEHTQTTAESVTVSELDDDDRGDF